MNLPFKAVPKPVSTLSLLTFTASTMALLSFGMLWLIVDVGGGALPTSLAGFYGTLRGNLLVLLGLLAVSTFILLKYKPTSKSFKVETPLKDTTHLIPVEGNEGFLMPVTEDPPFKEKRMVITLDTLLESAMLRGLKFDLEGKLTLPDDTTIGALGKEWKAQGVTISISKAPIPESPKQIEKPSDGMTPEEKQYYGVT